MVPTPENRDADVVVVGAGLAGHAAALATAETGAAVVLLEKGESYGGTSAKAGGGLVFAGTDLQQAAGVDDDEDALRATLLAAGGGHADPATVEAYVDHQRATYGWMVGHGVRFDYDPDLQPGQLNRLHGTPPGHAVDVLHARVAEHPGVQYVASAAADRLLRGDDRVTGILLDSGAELHASRGVVLSSGGFTRSDDLLAVFAPQWLPTTRMGGDHNTGDGLRMAWELGAGLADMSRIEASFGASVPAFPLLVDPEGGEPTLLFATTQGAVVVNRHGERFVDESLSYKKISSACVLQPDGLAFQVFDERVMRRSQPTPGPADFRRALEEGRVLTAPTLTGLATQLGLPADALERTVRRYNEGVDAGVDAEHGRPVVDRGGPGAARGEEAPFYAYPCRSGLTTTYCGLTVDRRLRVLDVWRRPIEGLWAAGEVVGGFHGASYYSGSALGKAAVLGRAAGLDAAGVPPVGTSAVGTAPADGR